MTKKCYHHRMTRNERRLLSSANKAVLAGGRVLLKRFQVNHTARYGYKPHREIITAADQESNAAIIRVLRKLTPDIPVLSEEGGTVGAAWAKTADLVWVLDPLDGTTNFTARLPLWGISLALARCGSPILGVISLPLLGHRYHAVKGRGAWMGRVRLHASKTKRLDEALGLMCYGSGEEHRRHHLRIDPTLTRLSRSTRRLGAAVIESSWVASGRADYSILNGIHDWDVAAGSLLVTEAGGRAVTPTGMPWRMGERDIVMSAPGVAKKVLKLIRT